MTKVTILGQSEAEQPKKKKIEFVKVSVDGEPFRNCDRAEFDHTPPGCDHILLIRRFWTDDLDLMWGYFDDGSGDMFLGHFNDGVV